MEPWQKRTKRREAVDTDRAPVTQHPRHLSAANLAVHGVGFIAEQHRELEGGDEFGLVRAFDQCWEVCGSGIDHDRNNPCRANASDAASCGVTIARATAIASATIPSIFSLALSLSGDRKS